MNNASSAARLSTLTPAPSLARRLRKRLGRIKCVLFDEWAYLPLVRLARARREQQRPLLSTLPPLRRSTQATCEVHMLCSHRDTDMGIWASWSLLRFLPEAHLYVHSDGTLKPSDMAQWSSIIEGVTFTSPQEREQRAAALATAYPAVHRWRTVHGCGSKFVDFHLFGRAERLVLLDSDVLCFSEPRELLDALANGAPSLRWNQDCTTSYAATPAQLSEILGFNVPARVNSGFLLTKRWDHADLTYLNGMLETLHRHGVGIYEWWAEQMLYATAAVRHTTATSFSANYAVKTGRTAADAVVRHYVGVPRIRPRFHTEGVPRLRAQLSRVRDQCSASPAEVAPATIATVKQPSRDFAST